MEPNIKYEDMTIEMKTDYNRKFVSKIIDTIHNMPIPYCAELSCDKCPCNIRVTSIVCIQWIQVIR
jgi:hypothetical protein